MQRLLSEMGLSSATWQRGYALIFALVASRVGVLGDTPSLLVAKAKISEKRGRRSKG